MKEDCWLTDLLPEMGTVEAALIVLSPKKIVEQVKEGACLSLYSEFSLLLSLFIVIVIIPNNVVYF